MHITARITFIHKISDCLANMLVINLLFLTSSYGSVYKAMHKETGQVVAIKQVPVDTDLQEIIKEISMMQQCDR